MFNIPPEDLNGLMFVTDWEDVVLCSHRVVFAICGG